MFRQALMMRRQKHTMVGLALVAGLLIAGACNKLNTPTTTVKAACTAVKNNDVAAYKRTYSKAKLASIEALAKQQHMPVNDLFNQLMHSIACSDSLATSDEKIRGEVATLNIQESDSKEFTTFHFVREDGEWKFAP